MKKTVLNVTVSRYDNIRCIHPVEVDLLEWMTTPKHDKEVEAIRATSDEDRRRVLKGNVSAVTPSGLFEIRNENGLLRHTGLLQIDIDFKDNTHITNYDQLKSQIANISNVVYCGLSVSGKGFWVIIMIAYPMRHKEHFDAVEKAFANLGIRIDPSGKDVSRLRIYSPDPQAYFNFEAIPFTQYKSNAPVPPPQKVYEADANRDRALTEGYIQVIIANEIDITHGYSVWFKIGCALANTFKESGRMYFHHVSQFSRQYNQKQADKQYSSCLSSTSKITLGTFIMYCNEAGISKDGMVLRYKDKEFPIEFNA